MPRAPRTKLLLKRQKLIKEISYFQECIKLKEEELESVSEIVRVRGPFMRNSTSNSSYPYKTIKNSHGRAISHCNAENTHRIEQIQPDFDY